jgi:hypothetical protein
MIRVLAKSVIPGGDALQIYIDAKLCMPRLLSRLRSVAPHPTTETESGTIQGNQEQEIHVRNDDKIRERQKQTA